MTDTSQINPKITDAVTQTNVKVVGEAPASAVAAASQAVAHATGLSMENASQTQGGMQQINNTATGALVALITQATPAPMTPASP
jgi:NifU-like protein involved in Fe-S cluster formation